MKEPAPIVLFVYNRPWHTEQVLNALMQNELAADSVLYVYCDGAKVNVPKEDIQKIEEVRKVIRKQLWCKQVHIIESEKNKGLANSIIDGVTDIIEKYGKVIVLEDDLVTSPYFLKYMNSALDFYKDYPAVFSVSANRPPIKIMNIPDDYEYDVFVSLRSYSTGWGTWADRWNLVDWSMSEFEKYLNQLEQIKALNRAGDDMTDLLKKQRDGKIDSWAIRFGFAHFVHHAVAILPCVAYVDNIGFDGSGTHSGTIVDLYHNDLSMYRRDVKFLDVIYEDARIINAFYNAFCVKKRPLWQKIINRISRFLGRKNVFVIKKKIYC